MVGVRVAGEGELLGITQGANVSARRDGLVCPLAAGVGRVSNGDVRDGGAGLVAPLDARGGVDFGVGIGADERVEQRVDGQGLCRVAQRRQEVGVEVGGQVEQIGLAAQFGVEQRIMVAADVVGNVAVQNVRQDEGRGAVALIYQPLFSRAAIRRRIPTITVSTHCGSERAMDRCSWHRPWERGREGVSTARAGSSLVNSRR
jgi:hypothetical protein